MTDAEFDEIRREIRERNARTSFPASGADETDYEAHSRHAEYGAGEH